ncbi:glycoside hydrolase family 18 protein [Actinacidiphila glaucinigra]|uniref:Uncharacterized protein n=1 Tax=Actinacidiphila glaucinigra TaxID=235986 RepID=A0A239J6R2_9ACTN|nr:hypothetical protein [Actinacidiphila glaucinigra]SNT01510.1 hypothetical protein SAMN05216252_112113 [Actinacidiphila glaucinigra]
MRNSHRRRPTRGVALLGGVTAGAVDATGALAVDITAMDYGPCFSGDMDAYAIDAATATATTAAKGQLKGVLGLSDAAAWNKQRAGGAGNVADPTCGSVLQEAGAFSNAYTAYGG